MIVSALIKGFNFFVGTPINRFVRASATLHESVNPVTIAGKVVSSGDGFKNEFRHRNNLLLAVKV